jgi:hypothetical protein
MCPPLIVYLSCLGLQTVSHAEPVWLHVKQEITVASMLLISVHKHAEYFTCLLLMRRAIYWLPKFNPYSRPQEIKPATLIRNELNIALALRVGDFCSQGKVQEE